MAECLQRFDDCLWRTRDSDGDGLLESFCVYDTGEDSALRYGDAPCWWEKDEPPQGRQVVPMASMDVTSWSYACRNTLSAISRITHDGKADFWRQQAIRVADILREKLWDDKRSACFDRERSGRRSPILCHNTLRCMYWGSISQEMADRFVEKHLLNPKEFWTPFPLPSVAANDPAFRNAPENNWSGQPEGLTYQRAILALENYGHHSLVTCLGEKLIRTIAKNECRFTQQFDPFTGQPSLVHAVTHQPVTEGSGEPIQDAYGPTMLACMEYIAHRFGVHPHLGSVWFSLGSGTACEYDAVFYGHRYQIFNDGVKAEIRVDGKALGSWACGIRLITDKIGCVQCALPIEGSRACIHLSF